MVPDGWSVEKLVHLAQRERCHAHRALTMIPGGKTRIKRVPHDLVLKASERLTALPVNRRHVDAEEAHQAVRLILHTRSVPRRGPRHTLDDAKGREVAPTRQDLARHVDDLRSHEVGKRAVIYFPGASRRVRQR